MRPRDYLPRLECLCKRSSSSSDGSYSTTTDNRGQFSFNSVSEGVYCIEAIGSEKKLRLFIDSIVVDRAFQESGTWIQIDTPRYDSKLKPPCTIKGVIIPEDDTASGTVQVFGLNVQATINPDGSFILDNLPRGTLRLKITTKQSGNVQDDTLYVPIIADESTGDPGKDSLNTLVRKVPEPAGSNCEAGGRRVETGPDINNNDTLDDDEVTDISYSCNEVRVLEGDYAVNSREDLDGMVYTEITGNVTISAPDIENVDGLSSLTSIGGDLRIRSNTALINIDGLSSITSIGGNLRIRSNAALTNLDGLSDIMSVGDDLDIYNNEALTSLEGLNSITSVGGDILICGNKAFTSLEGLNNITSVGGVLSISNEILTNLDELSTISSIGGGMAISHNNALTSLKGLSNITSVGDVLLIFGNHALTNLDGLNNITSLGGRLRIYDNDTLINLDGLSGIMSVGERVEIVDNDVLTSLEGLNSITSIGNLDILSNTSLTNLDGLSGITSIGGYLCIDNNHVLPTCQAQNIADDLVNNHGFTGTIEISGNDDRGTCP